MFLQSALQKHGRLLFVVVSVLSLLIYAFSSFQKTKKPSIPVNVVKVTERAQAIPIEAVGQVEAYQTVEIKSRVDGPIAEVHFKDGQEVKAGDCLLLIDPKPYQVTFDAQQAKLHQDQAQLENAESDFLRYQKLMKGNYASKEQFEQMRANRDALKAAVQGDQAAVAQAQLSLDYTCVRSPISGRTGALLVDLGNLVQANSANPLLVVNQMKPVKIIFSLPEKQLAQVRQSFHAGPVTVTGELPQSTTAPEQGVLNFIDNAVDTSTGTVQLKARFENAAEHFWPGQFVRVQFSLENIPNAFIVPTASLQRGQEDKPYLFVVDDKQQAHRRVVEVAATLGEETVVRSGVKAGERVVVNGQFLLTEGAHVSVQNKSA